MRRITGPKRSEAGQLLIIVVLASAVVALIVAPLLAWGFGAHRNAQIREVRMSKVYAADAGIEAAYYNLKFGNATEVGNSTGNISNVNGYLVQYTITQTSAAGAGSYSIRSTASDINKLTGNVTIVSHTGTTTFANFLDNALTSYGSITLKPNDIISGSIVLNGPDPTVGVPNVTLTCQAGNGSQCVSHDVPDWPTTTYLESFYWGQVADNSTHPPSTINIGANETYHLGNCWTTGDLTISGPGNFSLDGTLYVKGTLHMGSAVKVHLNYNTIFATGGMFIGEKNKDLEFFGPGSLIAEGEVNFWPKQKGTEFIFVMSVSKNLEMHPNGDWYGSLAGLTSIDLQPGSRLIWKEPPKENGALLLNFPPGLYLSLRIQDWIIID